MNLQSELEARMQWSRADVAQLAAGRPRTWTFRAGATFDDGALSALEGLPRLVFLALRDSDLSRDNLLSLARLPALRRLDLQGCRFDSLALEAFCDQLEEIPLPKLRELWLENCFLHDENLSALGKIGRLQWLILSGNPISDAGLQHLRSLRKLETLWLDRTPISDAGVLALCVLPILTGVVTRETACSPDISDQLFAAQLALQLSRKPLNPAQVEAAEVRLRGFLRAYEAWERDVVDRSEALEARFRLLRPLSNVFAEGEWEEHERFFQDIEAVKTDIAARFCSARLISRGVGAVQSYTTTPPPPVSEVSWLLVNTPSRTKTLFVAPRPSPESGVYGNARRFTMICEAGEWRLDEVQWWSGGWKRDYF